MHEKIYNKKELKETRKALRNNGTAAEAALWSCLKNRQLNGKKFRRQHSIHNIIVDFYCRSDMLIIELDGEGHFTASGQSDDEWKEAMLAQLGFTVLRYENKNVLENLESVLQDISDHFRM